MRTRVPFLFTGLFILLSGIVFSQSLYQDAKTLATIMRRQNDTGRDKGNLSFEFKAIKPMPYVYIDPAASLYSFNGRKTSVLEINAPGDFLLHQVSGRGDSIVLFNPATDSVMTVLAARYPYYLIRAKRLDNIGSGSISVFSPDGSVLLEHSGNFAKERVAVKVTTEKPDPEFMDVGDVNTAHTGWFVNNRLSMNKLGYYLIESLDSKDTLHLLSDGKVALTLYAIDKPSDRSRYSYVLRSGHGTDTLPGGFIMFWNRFDEIFFIPQNEYGRFYIKEELLKKSIQTTVELALETDESGQVYYIMHRNDISNPEDYKHKPSELKTRRMPLEIATYTFKFTEPRTQIAFYRDSGLIDTMEFSKDLSFSYRGDQEPLVLKTENPIPYKPEDVFTPIEHFSLQLDSFWLQGLDVEYVESGGTRMKDCFNYFKYSAESNQFEPFSPVPVRYPGDLFSLDGLYQAYLKEDMFSEIRAFIKSLQLIYWHPQKRDVQVLPIHWNPFAGFGPRTNPLEFLIENGKVTFFYVPALVQETRTIYLHKKDKLPTLLGTHALLKDADLESPNIWGEISAEYSNNPILARHLRPDLAANAFEELRGVPNEMLARDISLEKNRHYAWQQVVYDDAELDAGEQVSYEEVVRTYRTPVATASDNLQLASERFGSESKKLKRGLSTAAIAAGLSDFVVQRAQEELNLTFLDRLRDGILHDTAEFQVLFPQTGNMLREFKIVQYRTLLDFAKNAFVLDLRNLGLNFPKLFNLYKYRTIKNDPKVYNIFLLYDIANKVYEGMPVDTVLLHLHSRLQERRANLDKSVNLRLAATVRQHAAVRDSLAKIMDRFNQKFELFKENLENMNITYTDMWRMLFEDPAIAEAEPKIFERAANLDLVYTVDLDDRLYTLAQHNLQGDPDYAYVLEYLPFGRYQEYFSKPPDTLETISAGIALAEAILAPEQAELHASAMDKFEEAMNSMKALKMEMDASRAKSTIDLSDYIPTLESFKDLQIRRICLDLALETELARLEKTFKPFPEHERQSLIYLQKTLRMPANYQLYDWGPVDSFNRELLRIGLDTCKARLNFENEAYSYYSVSGNSAELNLLAQQRLLAALAERVPVMQPEIEKATEFLKKMADVIAHQFQKLAMLQARQSTEDTMARHIPLAFYKYFLLTTEMTSGTLAFSYDSLQDKLTTLIRDHSTLGAEIPRYEIATASRDSSDIEYKVQEYLSMLQVFKVLNDEQAGNPFLDAYDKILRFDLAQSFETIEHKLWEQSLLNDLRQTRESIAELRQAGAQYHQYLDFLKQTNAADLLASLRQTEEFATLTEITLQWLYAFKSGSVEMDSIVAQDSVVQRVKLIVPAQDGRPEREVSYDSIQIQQRRIASGPGVRQWITPRQFNEIMDDTLLRKAYLGLLYQRLSSIESGPRYAPANMALLATKFMNTIYEVDDMRENLRYKKRLNRPLSFEDYYPFIRTTIDLLNIVLETPPGNSEPLKDRFPTLAKVPSISNEVLSLFEHVFAENYPNAIRNVVQLLSIAWGLDESNAEQHIREGAVDTQTAANSGLLKGKPDKSEKTLQRQNQKVKSAILIYGSFMANMVGAQTPNQVKAAIQAVAVPPGSSSVKRKSSFSVTLNGYFGAGFHHETLTSETVPDDRQRGATFGLSVPIGLTVSKGGLGKSENWSYSLFLPVIDVGAITAYRLNQGGTQADLPELNFSNLVAPGAYFLVNLPKSPFTVGAGAQLGPQARKITINGLEQKSGAWRFGLIATIDVPIFNLFSR